MLPADMPFRPTLCAFRKKLRIQSFPDTRIADSEYMERKYIQYSAGIVSMKLPRFKEFIEAQLDA
ncbi:MAG: hypothetical protein IKP88_10120 [Lachnospiraceae bacterium]|nr:hypothetical protein [Lachnospiraceae bacterium]